jgi:conjugal transfer pilus assembly protein TraV
VSCTSVSGVFANASQHNLPAQKVTASASTVAVPAKGAPVESVAPASYSPKDLTAPKSGDPIRVPALVLRVWVAPWEDTEGDLHDQNYVYTILSDGRWKIEANRERIRDEFKPLFPLKSKKAEGADDPVNLSADGDEGVNVSATHAQMGGMPK